MPRRKKIAPPDPNLGPVIGGIHYAAQVMDIARVSTGLYGLNRAISGGVPERTITEISGYEGVGKSTVCNYLLGINGGPAVGILPFESYDPQYLIASLSAAGFQGQIREVPPLDDKGKVRDDEAMIDALADMAFDEDVKAILLDSVGAVSPVAEEEGSVREANMGRRARIMGPFMRKLERALYRHRKTPALAFLTNHLHPNIGVPGSNTSGGKAIAFHCATRLRLSALEKLDDGTKIIEGKVTKLRFRTIGTPDGAVFKIVIKPASGVHVGLTAVQDCIDFGFAEQTQGRVSLDGKNYGFWSKMVYEKSDDPEFFAPFVKKLAEN